MSYSSVILADGPSAYWRLGESSGTLADSSGNGRDLTSITNVTYGAAGLIASDLGNTAISVNATGFAQCASYQPSSTPPFTIEGWIKPDVVNIAQRWASSNSAWCAGITSSGLWSFTTIAILDYTFTTGPSAGTAYHVVYVFKTDQDVDIYVNGSFVETAAGTSNPNAPAAAFAICGLNAGDERFDGIVDEVALYEGVALNASQIAAHYNAAFTHVTSLPFQPHLRW